MAFGVVLFPVALGGRRDYLKYAGCVAIESTPIKGISDQALKCPRPGL